MFARIFTFKRFIFYGFPIYLLVVEYIFRILFSQAPGRSEDLAVVGFSSSVIAGGLSLIAAVLIPKPVNLPQSVAQTLIARGVVVTGIRDQRLIYAAYIALLTLPIPWGWAIWLVHTGNVDYDLAIGWVRVPAPFLVAMAIYVIGMAFNERKEIV